MPGNIVLIGFSGTGKSTVGRLLSERLGWPFVDVDELLVAHFGKSLDRVFAEEGESRFRAAEHDIIVDCCGRCGAVIAVGGGAVVSASNRSTIAVGNYVVRLDASASTILERLQSDAVEVRPLLATEDPLSRIAALMEARAAFYEIASYVVCTDDLDAGAVVSQIAQYLELETL